MSRKDTRQSRKERSQERDNGKRNWAIVALSVVAIVVVVGGVFYIFDYVPTSDKSLLDMEIPENSTLFVIKFLHADTMFETKNIPVRLTNHKTGDVWTYRTDKHGKVWILAENSSRITTYISKDGYHSELANFEVRDGRDKVEFTHILKPFYAIRFYINVMNMTGHPIDGAIVYFDGSTSPSYTDETGWVYLNVTAPRLVTYKIQTSVETYESEHLIMDYWITERVGIYMET